MLSYPLSFFGCIWGLSPCVVTCNVYSLLVGGMFPDFVRCALTMFSFPLLVRVLTSSFKLRVSSPRPLRLASLIISHSMSDIQVALKLKTLHLYRNYITAHSFSSVFIPQLKSVAIGTSLVHHLALSDPRSLVSGHPMGGESNNSGGSRRNVFE